MSSSNDAGLCSLHGHQIREKLLSREFTARDLTEAALDRIDAVDGAVNACTAVNREGALSRADEIDRRLASGEPVGPLAGLPVVIKDNICTRGVPTTCASRMLENFVPPYNATVVELLLAADAVIIGKTNLDEFAMGSSTETSAFGPTRNPWDTGRVAGGSSGGSAAALAAGEATLALGSDTGGSVRQPGSFCGVAGLKPTYGSVSRYGLIAFASSLDQVGPMANCVRDAGLLLNTIARYDPRDATSQSRQTTDYLDDIEEGVDGLRLGVPEEYFGEGLDADVRKAVDEALALYEKLGASIVDVSLPHTEYAVATYYVVATAEASSNLARYDGVHFGYRADEPTDTTDLYCRSRSEAFGREVKRRIMLGNFALSRGYYDAYYQKASRVRGLLRRDFVEAWSNVDCLVCPTYPSAAFRLGEKSDPLQMYLADVYTVPASLAGVPAMSIPAGFTASGLPVGLQLIAKPFDEAMLLRVGRAFERETDYHLKRPTLAPSETRN